MVSQADLDRPDPDLMRRLQLPHSIGHTSTPSLALYTRESVLIHPRRACVIVVVSVALNNVT